MSELKVAVNNRDSLPDVPWHSFVGRSPEEFEAIATLALLIVTVFAVLVAWRNLRELVVNNRARFIFELDTRWEGPTLTRARLEFYRVYEEIKDVALKRSAGEKDEAYRNHLSKLFDERLNALRNDKNTLKKYHQLTEIAGFFETAGLLAEKGYIKYDDIIELYGGTLVRVYLAFRHHPSSFDRDRDGIVGLYENCIELGRRAFHWMQSRTEEEVAKAI